MGFFYKKYTKYELWIKNKYREDIKSQRQEVDRGRESLVHAGKIVHKSSAKITMYIYIKFLLWNEKY